VGSGKRTIFKEKIAPGSEKEQGA
jgi:hypothetical protein